jgi:biopolymer transport protein ExbD
MGAKLGGSGGSKYTVESNADINVTPFVDIMLVLLIIFMVAVPVATVSIRLDMPPATPPPPGAPQPEPPTFISIANNGEYFIAQGEGVPVKTTLPTLSNDLLARLGSNEERVFVRADADVLYEDFMGVMNTLQENGWYQVGLINEDIS